MCLIIKRFQFQCGIYNYRKLITVYSSYSQFRLPPLQDAGVSITFINNSAGLSGAAIYASDLRLCSWVGNDYPIDLYTIFELPQEIAHLSPFSYMYVNSVVVKAV